MAEAEEEDKKDNRQVAFADKREEYLDRLTMPERMNGEELSHHDEHHDKVGPLGTDDIELGHPDELTTAPNFKQSKNLRESYVTDLSTGKKGGARAQNALVGSPLLVSLKMRDSQSHLSLSLNL